MTSSLSCVKDTSLWITFGEITPCTTQGTTVNTRRSFELSNSGICGPSSVVLSGEENILCSENGDLLLFPFTGVSSTRGTDSSPIIASSIWEIQKAIGRTAVFCKARTNSRIFSRGVSWGRVSSSYCGGSDVFERSLL